MRIGDEVYVADATLGKKNCISRATVTAIRRFRHLGIEFAKVKFHRGGTDIYAVGGGVFETREEKEYKMTTIEKVKETLARERTRRDEFYEGAAYAMKLVEAAQIGEAEQASTEAKPRTNADLVRAMTDEELANVLRGCTTCAFRTDFGDCIGQCVEGRLAWLKQEAK